jgi:hypothetical protein
LKQLDEPRPALAHHTYATIETLLQNQLKMSHRKNESLPSSEIKKTFAPSIQESVMNLRGVCRGALGNSLGRAR